MKSRFGQKCSGDWCKNDWTQVERAVVSCKPHFLLKKTEAVAFHFCRGHFNKHSYLSGIVLAEHALHVCTTKTLIFKNCCRYFFPLRPSIRLLLSGVVSYILPGLVWSFGCVADSDGRALLDSFFRRLASGQLQTNIMFFLMPVI